MSIKLVKSKKYYEKLYDIPWQLQACETNHGKLRIALINVPCGGFGDSFVCQTFYAYLKGWYQCMIYHFMYNYT